MDISVLLFVYGAFLIACGILAVSVIGLKAKTALISGGLSGIISMGVGHLIHLQGPMAPYLGILITGGLFGVFAWRATQTFYKIAELIPTAHPDLKGKTKAFLIIALMAVISMVVTLLQLVSYWSR